VSLLSAGPEDGPAAFWRLEQHDVLPSTSSLLITRAEAGEAEGLAILARQQTAGRARATRSWVSPPGNLFCSVLLRPDVPARDVAQWGLLAGVALADAAAEILPNPDALQLKWPNDLLLGGAKCSGILAETSLTPAGRLAWLVLGFGVNLAHAPSLPDRPTAAFGRVEPPVAFAWRLLRHLGHWRDRMLAEGFAPVRQAWLARGPAMGSTISLREGNVLVSREFAGLGADGSLLLRQDGAVRSVVAGEIEGQGAG